MKRMIYASCMAALLVCLATSGFNSREAHAEKQKLNRTTVPSSLTPNSDGSAQMGSAQEIRLEGELEVIYEDSHPSGRLLYFLHTGGKKLSVHFVENPPTKAQTGMRVAVRGVQVGETLELNSGNSMSQVSATPAVSGNPMGQHRVLVILVN